MSKESIVQRIISDAEAEAEKIVSEAERRAEEIVAAAKERARRNSDGTRLEAEKRAKAIADGKAATARLDCAKLELAAKRKVLDEVYSRALDGLINLGEKDSLCIAERVLKEYADDGDEILFDVSYKHTAAVAKLPIISEKSLKIAKSKGKLGGGFILKGKSCDKDVSYGAMLAADREERVAEIAAQLFSKG